MWAIAAIIAGVKDRPGDKASRLRGRQALQELPHMANNASAGMFADLIQARGHACSAGRGSPAENTGGEFRV